MILSIDKDLIIVIGAPTRDYKSILTGINMYLSSKRENKYPW